MQGKTRRESVAASGLLAEPGVPDVPSYLSVAVVLKLFLRILELRWVGGSVKFTSVRRSNGIGYFASKSISLWSPCSLAYPSVHMIFGDTILLFWLGHHHYTTC